jgi:hypothetical protein
MGHGVCGSDRLVVEFKSSYTISLSHCQHIHLKSVPTIVKVTVPLVEQELLTLSKHLISPLFLVGFALLDL